MKSPVYLHNVPRLACDCLNLGPVDSDHPVKIPVRGETQALLRFGGRLLPGVRALEIGCGSGYDSQLVLERFGAASVDAVDLDPAMIRRASQRLASYGDRVRLAQGNATDLRGALEAEDDSYDPVDYGIIHHIPDCDHPTEDRVIRDFTDIP